MKNFKLVLLFLGLSLTCSIWSMDDIGATEDHQSTTNPQEDPDNSPDTLKSMELTAGENKKPVVLDTDERDTQSDNEDDTPSPPEYISGQNDGTSNIGVSSSGPNNQKMTTKEAIRGLDLSLKGGQLISDESARLAKSAVKAGIDSGKIDDADSINTKFPGNFLSVADRADLEQYLYATKGRQAEVDQDPSDNVDWDNAVFRRTSERKYTKPIVYRNLLGSLVERDDDDDVYRDIAPEPNNADASGYGDIAPDPDTSGYMDVAPDPDGRRLSFEQQAAMQKGSGYMDISPDPTNVSADENYLQIEPNNTDGSGYGDIAPDPDTSGYMDVAPDPDTSGYMDISPDPTNVSADENYLQIEPAKYDPKKVDTLLSEVQERVNSNMDKQDSLRLGGKDRQETRDLISQLKIEKGEIPENHQDRAFIEAQIDEAVNALETSLSPIARRGDAQYGVHDWSPQNAQAARDTSNSSGIQEEQSADVFPVDSEESGSLSPEEFVKALNEIKNLGVSKSDDLNQNFAIDRLDDLLKNKDLTPEQRAEVVKTLDDYERYVKNRKKWFGRKLEGNVFYDHQTSLTKKQLKELKKNRAGGKMSNKESLKRITSVKNSLTSDDHLGLATRVGGVNFSDGYNELQRAYEKAQGPEQEGKVGQYQADYKQYLNDRINQEETGNRINTQNALNTGNRFHIQHLKDAGYNTTGAEVKDNPSVLVLSSDSVFNTKEEDAKHQRNLGQYYGGRKTPQDILKNYNLSDAGSSE